MESHHNTHYLDQSVTSYSYDRMHPPSFSSHNSMGPNICAGCSMPIDEQFLLCVMGASWHERCLVCVECREPLVTTCYYKEGNIYCKRDYFQIFGIRCSRCTMLLRPNEISSKTSDEMFHFQCFKCSLSDNHSIYRDSLPSCQTATQYHHQQQPSIQYNQSDPEDSYEENRCSSSSHMRNEYEPKRSRTILTFSQRHELEQIFDINSKPCRKVQENLSNQTGLSVRVVQVWFQNERAKMKKLQRRRLQNIFNITKPPEKRSNYYRFNNREEKIENSQCLSEELISNLDDNRHRYVINKNIHGEQINRIDRMHSMGQ